MSGFNTNMNYARDRRHASKADVLECFEGEKRLLSQLAFLITSDPAAADQSVANAFETTVKGHAPFLDWLLEWAKTATISDAISKCAETIGDCEAGYKDQGCSHIEHTSQVDTEQRAVHLNILLETDTLKVVEELDALSRAVLVLRLAIRSSIQDCVLRLNVARAAVVAANCRAMTWLGGLRLPQPMPEAQPGSPANDRPNEAHESHRRLRNPADLVTVVPDSA